METNTNIALKNKIQKYKMNDRNVAINNMERLIG